MSKLPQILGTARNRVSFEIVPPQRGHCPKEILESVERLCAFDPAFISVTNHPCVEYRCDDSAEHLVKIRPGTFGLSVAVREQFGCLVLPHLIGLGCTAESFEDELIDLVYAGFEDFFFIKGDSQKLKAKHAEYPEIDTMTMIERARAIARGEYLYTNAAGTKAAYSLGVAGYPGSRDPGALAGLKRKVEAGADWIITQMLFDSADFATYSKTLKDQGIGVPLIPGTRVITSIKTLGLVEKAFGVEIPAALKKSMAEARTPKEERKAGIAFSVSLVKELYEAGAPIVHIFTMGKSADVSAVLEQVK